MNQFESPFYQEFETGINGENSFELNPEFEFYSEYASANGQELSPEFEFEFDHQESEHELTQELMSVQNEAEFTDWLKKAAKKAAGAGLQLLDSPSGKKATAALTNIAQKTLRKGGQAISNLAQQTADRIPSYVRFATDTLRDLANEIRSGNPHPAVRPAIIRAALKHYPFILRNKQGANQRRPQPAMPPDEAVVNGAGPESNGAAQELETYNLEGSFNEVTEMELASELLAVQSEAELDQFLGKLIKKAAGTVSNIAKSGVGRALSGALKGVVKKALPVVGGAVGSFVAPGVGTAIGSKLGSMAGNLFELELEGLSAEDREFEMSRAFVRFAGNAARRASRMGRMNPQSAARNAIMNAARRYAPGMLVQNNNNWPGHTSDYTSSSGSFFDTGDEGAQSGNWYRQGNQVVIQGLFQ